MASLRNRLIGTGVAIVTPFSKDGQIDFSALEKIVARLIQNKIDYLVPLGSTGESATLSSDEQREVLDCVIKVNQGKLPIVAGNFGGKNTQAIVDKIQGYNFNGIDAILSASPEYSKPSQQGIYKHYMALDHVCPRPIIMYNVPGRTQSNMDWETTVKISQVGKKIIGIKEASANISQITKIIKDAPRNFLVISGDDETALATVACGGHGVISVIGNAFPKQFSQMIKSALNGEFKKARKFNNLLFDVHHLLYSEGNPTGIKAAMEILGLCQNNVRLPLTSMSAKGIKALKDSLPNL